MNQVYLDTARLLIQVAPLVFADGTFALKGGTAINLFIREMPRLSVDLDLVFPDHSLPREEALARIHGAIGAAAERLKARGFQTRAIAADGTGETKLLVRRAGIEVKIEVNIVMRGTVHPVRSAALTPMARNTLLADLQIPVVSLEDVYGGKLVAAMDRQHPRDIFDVMHMLERFGWQELLIDCFVAYLAGHNRPVHEVLFPVIKQLEPTFSREFVGMTREPLTLDALTQTQVRLITELPRQLLPRHRTFLLLLVQGVPAWHLMPFGHLRELPAIKWKLMNLERLKKTYPMRFSAQHDVLSERLEALE